MRVAYVALYNRFAKVTAGRIQMIRHSLTISTTCKPIQVLLANQWQLRSNASLILEYKSIDKDFLVLETDLALIWYNTFKAIVQEYAIDEQWFKVNFAKAWQLLMNADMFLHHNGASRVFSWSFSIVFLTFLSIYSKNYDFVPLPLP